tara:strand:+ start:68 stop:940 length:873 start_codon:yes stop_codon:yes gene_type:complete
MIVSGNLSKTFGFYFSVISLLAIAACSDSGPSSDSGQAELNQAPPEPDAYYEYLWCKQGDNWSEQTMGALVSDWNGMLDGLENAPDASFGYAPDGWQDDNFDGLWVLRWASRDAMESGWADYASSGSQEKLNAAHPGVLECGAEQGVNRFGWFSYMPKDVPDTFDPSKPYYLTNQLCSFNDGKSREDLRAVVGQHFLPAVMEAAEVNPSTTYWFRVERNDFDPLAEYPVDFNWVNFWQTKEEAELSSQTFAQSENGMKVAEMMSEVATCTPTVAQPWNGYLFRPASMDQS